MAVSLSSVVWFLLVAGLLAVALWLLPRGRTYYKQWRGMHRRALLEDILKYLVTRQLEGREASAESIAGHLSIPQPDALRQVMDLEKAGMVRSEGARLRLSAEGQQWALQVVRAHRLWETYLADEARMPLGRVHQSADAAEHKLTPGELDELEARLGHPRSDPHGDPIPTAAGRVETPEAQPLTSWPAGVGARIVHVEDEPQEVFDRITARGLRPGATLDVTGHSAGEVIIRAGGMEHRLPPALAGSIQVTALPEARVDRSGWVRLADLKLGEEAVVMELDAGLRGLTRRRLLDLGLTVNARVTKQLENFFGDPIAFRVRGATIALRREQASRIWVRTVPGQQHQGAAS